MVIIFRTDTKHKFSIFKARQVVPTSFAIRTLALMQIVKRKISQSCVLRAIFVKGMSVITLVFCPFRDC